MTTPAPATPDRFLLLDAVRGFALIGLFLVHIQESYELYWSNPQMSPVTAVVWGLFMGKSFSMLALCFGVSFYIIMERSSRRGVDFTGRFVWRLCVLFLISLFHGLFYRGDILQVLALTGLILIPLDRIKNNLVLMGIAIICFLQPWQVVQIIAASHGAAWANLPSMMNNDTSMDVMLHGDFFQVMWANSFDGRRTSWLYSWESGRVFQLFGLFTTGLLLGRIKFFQNPDAYRLGRRVAILLLAGLWLAYPWLADLAQHIPQAEGQYMARKTYNYIVSGWRDLAQMGVMLLLLVEAYQLFARKALNLLAPVGRMTLTFYVLQSMVFVPIFYPFGLDLYHHVTPWQQLAIGLSATAVQIIFANLWFKGFVYGPLEWVWRATTYLTLKVPFKRKA